MTPSEKAIDLLKKFIPFSDGKHNDTIGLARQCALIAVDEILMLSPAVSLSDSMYDYWGEVKEALENVIMNGQITTEI